MRSDEISSFLVERIEAEDFPSAVYLVAERGNVVFLDALGYAVVEPERIEAKIDTLYDLASLTKPLVTGLLAAILIERGEMDPNETVGNLLSEFYVSGNAEITVNQLLMHTSGLPAWRPFYLLVERPEEIAAEIAHTLQLEDQEAVVYSDLNFISLGYIIERLTGNDLETVFQSEVASALGLSETRFNPLPMISGERIAASEKGNEYEKQTCAELGHLDEQVPAANKFGRDPFRKYQIWGEVHDGNAWFMEGIAGHAGLFSSAEDVFNIALQFLPGFTRLLRPETCELFRTSFTRGLNEDRSVAFQLATTEGSTAGTRLSPSSFGHNGFTGTSLWIDPVKDRIFVLLTNRTHAHSLPFANINSVRRLFHDKAANILDTKI